MERLTKYGNVFELSLYRAFGKKETKLYFGVKLQTEEVFSIAQLRALAWIRHKYASIVFLFLSRMVSMSINVH